MTKSISVTLIGAAKVDGIRRSAGWTGPVTPDQLNDLIKAKALPDSILVLDGELSDDGQPVVFDQNHPLFENARAWADELIEEAVRVLREDLVLAGGREELLNAELAEFDREVSSLREQRQSLIDSSAKLNSDLEAANAALDDAQDRVKVFEAAAEKPPAAPDTPAEPAAKPAAAKS